MLFRVDLNQILLGEAAAAGRLNPNSIHNSAVRVLERADSELSPVQQRPVRSADNPRKLAAFHLQMIGARLPDGRPDRAAKIWNEKPSFPLPVARRDQVLDYHGAIEPVRLCLRGVGLCRRTAPPDMPANGIRAGDDPDDDGPVFIGPVASDRDVRRIHGGEHQRG